MKLVYRKLSTWLLAVLGVSGCSDLSDIFKGKEMYGCPNADFKINAVVTDEAGNPVAGIEAMPLVKQSDGKYYQQAIKGTATDASGKVQMGFSNVYSDPDAAVAFTDTDGDANGGAFQADTVKNITFTQTSKGKGSWDLGDYEANISVKLKKQK